MSFARAAYRLLGGSVKALRGFAAKLQLQKKICKCVDVSRAGTQDGIGELVKETGERKSRILRESEKKERRGKINS
jgi:hypothetical protein